MSRLSSALIPVPLAASETSLPLGFGVEVSRPIRRLFGGPPLTLGQYHPASLIRWTSESLRSSRHGLVNPQAPRRVWRSCCHPPRRTLRGSIHEEVLSMRSMSCDKEGRGSLKSESLPSNSRAEASVALTCAPAPTLTLLRTSFDAQDKNREAE